MMLQTPVVLVVSIALFAPSLTRDLKRRSACTASPEEQQDALKSYKNKCLEKGWETSLEGCTVTGDASELTGRNKKNCEALDKVLLPCAVSCGVNGKYGKWSDWGECSEECGGGVMVKTRECDSPAPSFGGAPCEGENRAERACNTKPCKDVVDGGWSEWEPVGECSAKCGGGQITFARACDNPKPSEKGADCVGNAEKTEECNLKLCPVDGGFGVWSAWSKCSKECGGGVMKKSRKCDSPSPANGGADCEGETDVESACNEQSCVVAVDGGFGAWSDWSKCSEECNGGKQSQTRKCDSPAPANGGAQCVGETIQTRECNIKACKVYYKITHRTGKGEYDAGAKTGQYDFTLIGTDGIAGPVDCPADRSKGVYSECVFIWPTDIGDVRSVKIKNKGTNMWAFTSLFILIRGSLNARWRAVNNAFKVPDNKEVVVPMTNVLDHDISYTITHRTGTGKWDEGGRSGVYDFWLIGTRGETKAFDCNAIRSAGKVGSCTIQSDSDLGELVKVRIKNKSNNLWVFNTFQVTVDGKVVADWKGTKKVPDRQTVLAVFQ